MRRVDTNFMRVNVMNFDPNLWGSSMWLVLHTAALKYPNKPSAADKNNMHKFVTSLQYVLPCEGCCRGFQTILDRTKFGAKDLKNSDALFAWTVLAHAMVNEKLGKPGRRDWKLWKARYLSLAGGG